MRAWVLVLVLVLSVVGLTPGVAKSASDDIYISAVRFEGNARTREQIMLQEMRVRPGQYVSGKDIEASRQAVMDLGLFQWVRAELEQAEGGKVLVIRVKEKIYVLPVPLLDGDPQTQDVKYGAELRLDNLMGMNQRVKLVYEHEDSTDAENPTTDAYRASYTYPRVMGTPYTIGLDTRLIIDDLHPDNEEDGTGHFERELVGVGANVSRWLMREGPSAGWRGGLGLGYTAHKYEYISGDPTIYENGKAVSVSANLGFDEVHDHGYYRTGSAYGWNGDVGVPQLGSDFSFTRNRLYFRTYRYFPNQTANLNWQVRMGFANGEAFGSPAFSIGGFDTLRGYEDSLRGNGMALSNIEYQKQINGYPSLRGVVFLDVGNVYPEIVSMDLLDVETGLGFGVRWHLQFLVDVTISADIGYGLGNGTPVAYLGTRGSF